LGERGRGAVEHCGIDPEMAYIGGSLGKAFGTCGGIIPATTSQVAAMRATPVGLGASVGLPAGAAMCARSLRYVREHPELVQRLRANTQHIKAGLGKLGVDVGSSVVPIAAFATGSISTEVLKRRLMDEGIYVYHSTYIGASAGGVIRCGIFADHTTEHINFLLQALQRFL
jgi:7-keto-8-aminopelargonate synthetase-like enzyme